MQKEQQKRPYLAPEITMVDFKVEVGQAASLEVYTGNGVQQYEQDLMHMMFLTQQNGGNARMGDGMSYFGYEGGSYFGTGSTSNGSYF